MAVGQVASNQHSVYALATPPGRSAIAVVRATGGVEVQKFLESLNIKKNTNGCFVRALKIGGYSDSCLVLSFPSPKSFTGENVVEIHCHGNPVIVSGVFKLLDGFGMSEAERGDFSKRAFMNGKIGLDEAESILLGIEAGTEDDLVSLESFRKGELGSLVLSLSRDLESLMVEIESQLDFSDEGGVGGVEKKSIQQKLNNSVKSIEKLLVDYRPMRNIEGKRKVVILGLPNAGKSSLFNSLLGSDVAIVSKDAGTTRDIVRKDMVINGLDIEVSDTAGIRRGKSFVEEEGVKKSFKALEGAEVSIWVSDPINISLEKPKTDIQVLNKCDLIDGKSFPKQWLLTSAKTGSGIEVLKKTILKKLKKEGRVFYVSERVYKKLEAAKNKLSVNSDDSDFFELTAQNIRESLIMLEEIYGEYDNEKILGEIFNKFCIGK